MKYRIITIALFLIISFCFSQQLQAKIYEYEFTASPDVDSIGFAHYKIYINENIDTIKGVYCYIPGWQGSSLEEINNVELQEYVSERGLALMCFKMLGNYTSPNYRISPWSGEALEVALKELSVKSKHPELEYSALLFDGSSAGGQFSYHFTQWKPERVIAFVTIKGGYHSLIPAIGSITVPGYMFIGENDEPHRIKNLTSIFEANRPSGALWTLAIQPNAGHERVPKEIIQSYFDQILPLRLPDKIPLDTYPSLKIINEEEAWLGDRICYEVSPYNKYKSNRDAACWFPNEKIAREWQNFVQGKLLSDIN